MKVKYITGLILSVSIFFRAYSQHPATDFNGGGERCENCYRFMFYNVENLFDPKHDTLKSDLDFTPEGKNRWTYTRYIRKINNILKVIMALGGWEPPEMIGLAEIENEHVLRQLVYYSPLKKFNYHYIHYESPDARGVDVAFLYRKEYFRVICSVPICIRMPGDTLFKTRDVLYIRGIAGKNDTLHLFINHWPSSYGGYMNSMPKRHFVAGVVRGKVDSLLAVSPAANILIAGDFNDECSDESIINVLKASMDTVSPGNNLIDLMSLMNSSLTGSHKFAGRWSNIDQIIVSKSLFQGKHGMKILDGRAHIFKAGFLLEEDRFGEKPFRTFLGPRYIGGFSDHLPVYTDIICE